MPRFSTGRLVIRSLVHYLPSNAAAAAAVAVATAVITGSLLVGHSVRGSLRDIALERLGRIDVAVTTDGFVPGDLAARIAAQPELSDESAEAVPALLLEGAVRPAGSERTVPDVSVIGVAGGFRRLGEWPAPGTWPEGRGAVLNARLAEDLGARVGDAVILSVRRRGAAPVGTVFGRTERDDVVATLRLEVTGIVEAEGLGRFGLRPVQQAPRNLYVSLPWLQERTGRDGRANTVLVAGARAAALKEDLPQVLTPADIGLDFVVAPDGAYTAVQSERLVLGAQVVDAAQTVADRLGLTGWASSIYLANDVSRLEDGVEGMPYSLVMGLPPGAMDRLLTAADGGELPTVGTGEVLLTQWAAEDLGATVDDRIRMTYFASDVDGNLTERSREARVAGVVVMSGPAADATLTPQFAGLTDAETMGEWDPPFPFDAARIRPKDEEHWETYGAAPKLFAPLETVREMWAEGRTDSGLVAWRTAFAVDVPASGAGEEEFADEVVATLAEAGYGLAVRPVREEALAAAVGSSDFGVLFASMSGFLVIAAAVLIALLCRLAIERRASQFGLLMATGLSARRSARVLLAEGGAVAAVGAALGLPLGIGYAWFTVAMLRTRWAAAVGQLDLAIHLDAGSVPGLAAGLVSGLVVSLLAMLWAARMLKRSRPLLLLAGWQTRGLEPRPRARRIARVVAAAAGCLGIAAVALALITDALPDVPAFFFGGSLLLTGILALALSVVLPSGAERKPRPLGLALLARRGASVNPVRSFLMVALLACASFVIVVVGANQRDVSRRDTRDPSAGAGGFDLMASCQLPVHEDMGTAAGREELGFGPEQSQLLGRCRIVSMRLRAGEDASCLNMQRPRSPRVLGVPVEEMADTGFGFAQTAPEGAGWNVLEDTRDGYVPAAADASSAQWILKMGLGDEVTVTGEDGGDVRLRLAGMLQPGVFAAELLVAEDAFVEHFGAESGYQRFLIRTPVGEQDAVREALVENLGELGMTVERTADVLAGFARVQNTYLATFQTLGGLGLLLGTFGVVAVVLRAIVERRRELAVLRALGLPRPWIAAMLALENVFLLVLGVAVGAVAAIVAVAPHLSEAEAEVDWRQLAGTLAICVIAGAASCAVAAALALRRELLPALRSE